MRHPRTPTAGGDASALGRQLPGSLWVAVGIAAAVSALFGTVAADSRWLAAIGAYVVRHGSIPDHVPFASAPSAHWPNVPVLAELTLHALQSVGGSRALLVAQAVSALGAFALLAVDMRRGGASEPAATTVLVMLVPATVVSLAAIRVELFSVLLFPVLLVLLREESRRASRRVWLLVPLFAIWSNLHGAVLVGLAVAAAYLLIHRARGQPVLAASVLATSALAVCATPALWRTPAYYHGVLDNEAARRGFGQWEPLSLGSGFALAFVVVAAFLAVAAVRARPPAWEIVTIAALAALTGEAGRGSVWLAFFLATPAALGLRRRMAPSRSLVTIPALAVLAVLVVVGIVRGPHESAAGRRLLADALSLADGTPILATETLAEQVALAGGKVWIGNPLDAFRSSDQRLYVDWLQGRPGGDAALRHAPRVVLTRPGSPSDRRLEQLGVLHERERDGGAVLYVR